MLGRVVSKRVATLSLAVLVGAVLAMLIFMVQGTPLEFKSAYADPYNASDVAVINKIIDDNGLKLQKADPADGSVIPADWKAVVTWSGKAPDKRVSGLDLTARQLTGELDVSALSGLKALNFSRNDLTLSALPAALTTLACMGNQLTALPVLPAGLTELHCDDNQLTALPALPTGLTDLTCSSNQLTTLPVLPSNLDELTCSDNLLSSLPALPSSLSFLNCSINWLQTLPDMPSGLESLICSDNILTSLPSLPNGLFSLDCSKNRLTKLVLSSASEYIDVDVSMNRLTDTSAVTGADIDWDSGAFVFAPQNVATVTVVGGQGGGSYAAEGTVTLTADAAPVGQAFKEWQFDSDVAFADGTSAADQTVKFTMSDPAQDVTATAVYAAAQVKPASKPIPKSSGSSGSPTPPTGDNGMADWLLGLFFCTRKRQTQ